MTRYPQGVVAVGALALAGVAAAWQIPAPLSLGGYAWPLAGAFTAFLFVLQQQGFVFRWRQQSTKVSLDEMGIFLGVLALAPAIVVGAVVVSSLANQLLHRRDPAKTAFNTAQYTLAATFAVGAATAARFAGVPAPWFGLLSPVIFSATTALLVSVLFGRIERIPAWRVFRQRFANIVLITSTLGVSLGLIAYALALLHPVAILAVVPIFAYLKRFGRLSEWADDELKTHKLVASVSADVAGQGDLERVGDRLLATCHELFDCGEASLTLARPDDAAPRIWHRKFSPNTGFGGVAAEILGPDGGRIGALSVFPKPGQKHFGEREHHLLRAVAASAAAAAANAEALRDARDSEARYRNLFETAHVLVHVVDREGRVTDANPAALAASGHTRKDLQGRSLVDIVQADLDILHRLREEGEVIGLECGLRTTHGEPRTVLLDAKAVGDDKGRFVVFARDITSLKGLEAELRRSMARQEETIKRLENMNRELEEFTLWTTHDMREPLRSIGTIADFLHEDIATIDREEARDMARRISQGADRLKERVKALHAFSLIVQRDDEFQDVDMQRVIENVVTTLETKIAEKGAQVVLAEGGFPVVRAQAHRIDQVFANLIENALKYGRAMDPDQSVQPRPRVEVGVTSTSAEWRFFVKDNGPGVPASYHDRIFQLFQRGPASQESGSGAGLAIVKRIAEQHGGRAWVESRGEGACFYVALPKVGPSLASPPAAMTR